MAKSKAGREVMVAYEDRRRAAKAGPRPVPVALAPAPAAECGCKPTALKLIVERAATAPHGLVYVPDVVRSLVETGVSMKDAQDQIFAAARSGDVELLPATRIKPADKEFAPLGYGGNLIEYAKLRSAQVPAPTLEEAHMTSRQRAALPASSFALPAKREFPINDAKHVRAATSRLEAAHREGRVTGSEYAMAKRRIAAAAKRFGVQSEYAAAEETALAPATMPTPSPNPIAAAPTSEEWEVVVTGVPEAHRGAIMNLVGPGEAESVGRNKVVLRGFYDDREAANVARAVTRQYGVSAVYGPARAMKLNAAEATPVAGECGCTKNPVVEGASPAALETRSNPIASDFEGEDAVCKPFTRISRDPGRFTACMARAKQIGELKDSLDFYRLVAPDIQANDEEHFYIACIDYRGQLRDFVDLAIGQRHKVSVDIEDIMAAVLLSKCDGFCVCHSHPSGHASPSDADRKLTAMITRAQKAACPATPLLDHIVIGINEYYSFRDKRLTKVK